MRGRALVLIGFMGCGKSAAGRALAHRLRLPRFDTDEMVVAHFGMPITQIFAQLGEAQFRERESAVLQKISSDQECVVVTGGGIVLRRENGNALRRLGFVAHLFAREDVIFDRVSRRSTRPLLQTANPRTTVMKLMQTRAALYRAIADASIDTSDLTHAQVADAVLDAWQHHPETAAL